jgi:hypothetical protein
MNAPKKVVEKLIQLGSFSMILFLYNYSRSVDNDARNPAD